MIYLLQSAVLMLAGFNVCLLVVGLLLYFAG